MSLTTKSKTIVERSLLEHRDTTVLLLIIKHKSKLTQSNIIMSFYMIIIFNIRVYLQFLIKNEIFSNFNFRQDSNIWLLRSSKIDKIINIV